MFFRTEKKGVNIMTDQQTNTLETPEVSQPTAQASNLEEVKEIDWKAEARKWEQRAKENKGKADEFEEYRTKTEKELERAKARAKKAEDKSAELSHANEVRKWTMRYIGYITSITEPISIHSHTMRHKCARILGGLMRVQAGLHLTKACQYIGYTTTQTATIYTPATL